MKSAWAAPQLLSFPSEIGREAPLQLLPVPILVIQKELCDLEICVNWVKLVKRQSSGAPWH